MDKIFDGLYGEVVKEDIYFMRDTRDIVSINDSSFIHVKGHKRKFNFVPSVIFDLGANIGVFTKYCRGLFPDAKIISVEPHPENFKHLVPDENTICINKAIGNGKVWKPVGAANGTGECYISKTIGYENIEKNHIYEPTETETITIKELFDEYVKPEDDVVVKMDIEGGENSVFIDKESVDCLLRANYFTMEYHYFGMTMEDVKSVKQLTDNFMYRFLPTHDCSLKHPIFYASKF